jgi:hypothetical protein
MKFSNSRRKNVACRSLAAVISLTSAISLQAGNYSWTGAGNDGLWSNSLNWTAGGPPSAIADVASVIGNDISINLGGNAWSIYDLHTSSTGTGITVSNGHLTLNDDTTLTTTAALRVRGTIRFSNLTLDTESTLIGAPTPDATELIIDADVIWNNHGPLRFYRHSSDPTQHGPALLSIAGTVTADSPSRITGNYNDTIQMQGGSLGLGVFLTNGAILSGYGTVGGGLNTSVLGSNSVVNVAGGTMTLGNLSSASALIFTGTNTSLTVGDGARAVLLNGAVLDLPTVTTLTNGELSAPGGMRLPAGSQINGAGVIRGVLTNSNTDGSGLTGSGMLWQHDLNVDLRPATFDVGADTVLLLSGDDGDGGGLMNLPRHVTIAGGTLDSVRGGTSQFTQGASDIVGFGTVTFSVGMNNALDEGISLISAEGGNLSIGRASVGRQWGDAEVRTNGNSIFIHQPVSLFYASTVNVGTGYVAFNGGIGSISSVSVTMQGGDLLTTSDLGRNVQQLSFSGFGVIQDQPSIAGPLTGISEVTFQASGPLTLSAPLSIGSNRVTLVSSAPVALPGITTLAGGTLQATGGLNLNTAQIQGYGFVFGPFPFDQNLANVFQVQGAIPTSAKFTPSGAPQVAILSSTVYKPTGFFFTPDSLQIYAPGGLAFEGNNAILQVNGSLEVRGPLSFLTPNNHQVNGTLTVTGDLTVHNANLAAVGGTTHVQGNVSLQNGVINSALNVTGQVSGFGLTGPIQATGGIVPTAQLTGITFETVSTELHAISLGPWLLTDSFHMAGGTLVADQGIKFSSQPIIRGYGTIDATVSGDASFDLYSAGAPGGVLSMGRSDRNDGVHLTSEILINDTNVRLLDANEAYVFSIRYFQQSSGTTLLDVPNGLRVNFFRASSGGPDLHMKITGPLVVGTSVNIFNRGSLDLVSLVYSGNGTNFFFNGELRLRGSSGHPARLGGQLDFRFDVLFAENGVLQQSDDVWDIGSLNTLSSTIAGDAFMDGRSLAPQGVTIRGGLFGRGSVAGLVTLDGATLTTTSNFDGLSLAPRSLFSPGRDGEPGRFTIEPDAAAAFVMINDPNSVFDLGGTVRGDQYDALSVAGPLTLDGGLLVRLINGFVPEDGDRFDLFDFTSLDGAFDQMSLPQLTPGLAWDTSSLSVDGSIVVVPEPACGILFSAGAVLVAFCRRRTGRRE